MKMHHAALWSTLTVATLGILGCDVLLTERTRREPVYIEQHPRYVEPRTVIVEQEPQPQYVIVRQAPPPVRVELRPAPPSVDVVWIDGYWNWSNQTYSWEAGRYVRPPQPDVIWVAPRYENDVQGVRFTAGQWTKKKPGNGNDNNNGRGRGRGN